MKVDRLARIPFAAAHNAKYFLFDRFQFGLPRGGNQTILRVTDAYPVGASHDPQ
jgi:hypothetical protein